MTLSYDAGTFTLETREGTFEFVGRDIVSIEGRAKKTIVKLNKAGMPHMLRLAASNGFTYASTLEGYRQDSLTIDISGGGGTTDLFTNTTASEFVKTNATNDGLESVDLFGSTTAGNIVKTNSGNNGLESVNLFTNTADKFAVGVNSSNNNLSKFKAYYNEADTARSNFVVGRQTDVIGTASAVYFPENSIVIGNDPIGNKTINSSGKVNVIAFKADEVKLSDITVIGNSTQKAFISHGGQIRRKYYNIISDSAASPNYPLVGLIMGGYINGSDSAKTLTVSLNSIDYLKTYFIDSSNGNDKWLHAEFDFIVDNTVATSTNHITLSLSGSDLSVNGTDSLVVNAGTIGKFTAVIHRTPGGAYQKVKICRVF